MHAPALFALCLCAAIGGLLLWRSAARKPADPQDELPELLQQHQQITDYLDSSDSLFASESECEVMEHRLAVVEHAIRRRRRARSRAVDNHVPPPPPAVPAAPGTQTREAVAHASGEAADH